MMFIYNNGWSYFACVKRYLEEIDQLLREKVLKGKYIRICNSWI
jgi:hypothetical protein